MKIRIELLGILAERLPKESKGKGVVELGEESTVKDLLEKLSIKRKVTFALNDEHDLDERQQLKDGDEVLVFTSVGGG
mgnify:FL=1